jgi:hercynylcysteine S-oxide lyase
LLNQVVELLVKAWETSSLELATELQAPYMKMIKLPILKSYKITDQEVSKICPKLMEDLIDNYNVVACVVYVQGVMYCRISCFVYNELNDYIKLKDAILDLKE